MSLVGTFQSRGCVRGATWVVFLSLIKHLCQNTELVLTEHRALSRAELVLTATSSHQIYTCTHSETTPELIAGSWTHIMSTLNAKKMTVSLPSIELCANTGTLGSEQLENIRGLKQTFGSSGPNSSMVALKTAFKTNASNIQKKQSYM